MASTSPVAVGAGVGNVALNTLLLCCSDNRRGFSARAAANRTACLSNIKQLGTGVLMYCNDNKGYFPTCAWGTDPSRIPFPDDWIHWQANRNLDDSAIAPYVGRGETLKRLLRCPA